MQKKVFLSALFILLVLYIVPVQLYSQEVTAAYQDTVYLKNSDEKIACRVLSRTGGILRYKKGGRELTLPETDIEYVEWNSLYFKPVTVTPSRTVHKTPVKTEQISQPAVQKKTLPAKVSTAAEMKPPAVSGNVKISLPATVSSVSSAVFPDTIYPSNRQWAIACTITNITDGVLYYQVNGIPLSIKEEMVNRYSWHSKKTAEGNGIADKSEVPVLPAEQTETLSAAGDTPTAEPVVTVTQAGTAALDTLFLSGIDTGLPCKIIDQSGGRIVYTVNGKQQSINKRLISRISLAGTAEATAKEFSFSDAADDVQESIQKPAATGTVTGNAEKPELVVSKSDSIFEIPPSESDMHLFPDTIFPADKAWTIACTIQRIENGIIVYSVNGADREIRESAVKKVRWHSKKAEETETVPEVTEAAAVKSKEVIPEKAIWQDILPDTLYFAGRSEGYACKIIRVSSDSVQIGLKGDGDIIVAPVKNIDRIYLSEKDSMIVLKKPAEKENFAAVAETENNLSAEKVTLAADTIFVKGRNHGLGCDIIKIEGNVIYYKVKDLRFTINTSYVDNIRWSSKQKYTSTTEAAGTYIPAEAAYTETAAYPDTILPAGREYTIACTIERISRDSIYYTLNEHVLSLGNNQVDRVYWSRKQGYSRFGAVNKKNNADGSDDIYQNILPAESKAVPSAGSAGKMVKTDYTALPDTLLFKDAGKTVPCRIISVDDKMIFYRYENKVLSEIKDVLAGIYWQEKGGLIRFDHTFNEHDKTGSSSGYSREPARSTDTEPVLHAGDRVSIAFVYNPELNQEVTIGMDGTVSLQLIGNINVSGMTVARLRETLKNRYGEHLQDPALTVIARSLQVNKVFIGGEGTGPGIIDLKVGMTLFDAVGKTRASSENIPNGQVIMMRNFDGKRYADSFSLTKITEATFPGNVSLIPRDIIIILTSPAGNVQDWIDRKLFSVVPPWFAYSHDTSGPVRNLADVLKK